MKDNLTPNPFPRGKGNNRGESDAPNDQTQATHPREVVVDAVGDSLNAEVKYSALRWRLSGEDVTAPDPVSSFLGALGGCLLMSLRVAARVRKVELGRSSVHARANEKGHLKEIKVELQVESSASDEQMRRLVEVAERGCHIRNLIREEIVFGLTVTRI
jgi:organic hydroperoxide reductase OsmC/OhrA